MLNVLKLMNFQLNEVATTCVPKSYNNMSECWNFVPHYFFEVFGDKFMLALLHLWEVGARRRSIQKPRTDYLF